MIQFLQLILACTTIAFASPIEGYDFYQPPVAIPSFDPRQGIDQSAIEREGQLLPLTFDAMSCSELEALSKEQKEATLLAVMYFQKEGILNKIVGPECAFLGEVERIAVIDDPALTVEPKKESLYFASDIGFIFVSHTAKQTIAYGLQKSGNLDPLSYFQLHRDEAVSLANFAKSFVSQTQEAQLPKAIDSEPRTWIPEEPIVESIEDTLADPTPKDLPEIVEENAMEFFEPIPVEEIQTETDIDTGIAEIKDGEAGLPPKAMEEEDKKGEKEKKANTLVAEPSPASTPIIGDVRYLFLMIFFGIAVIIVAVVSLRRRKMQADATQGDTPPSSGQ